MSHFTIRTSMNAHPTENPASVTMTVEIMCRLHAAIKSNTFIKIIIIFLNLDLFLFLNQHRDILSFSRKFASRMTPTSPPTIVHVDERLAETNTLVYILATIAQDLH